MKQIGQEKTSKLFPLVDASPAMQQLLGIARGDAKYGWYLPLVVAPENRLELMAFFLRVAAEHRRSDYYRVLNGTLPKTHELERDDATALLVMKGDSLPPSHQRVLAAYRHNFPLVILTVQPNSEQIVQGEGWLKELQDACSPLPLVWPVWAEREEDHTGIIRAICSRLSMPLGQAVPEFDDRVMEYLERTPFSGTGQVEHVIKEALKRYIQSRSTGPLTVQHFTVFKHARILMNRRPQSPVSLIR